ncbi:MAG: hypothetical protein V1813_01275 [Candidatus Aenigmatarchaeota archaeon]
MAEGGNAKGGFFHRTFGPAGPMAMSVFWTFIIALMVWMLSFAASMVDIPGMLQMLIFFRDGILYIFLFMLFLSYASYFMMKERRFLIELLPAACSVGVLAALWIASGTLSLLEDVTANEVSIYAGRYMLTAPAAVLAVGYAIVAALFFFQRPLFSRRTGGTAASAAPFAQAAAPSKEDDERKRKELKNLMKEAEKKYLGRQIDRETFDKIARDYHERITELDARKAAGNG